jgi:hypothetical protein
MSEMETHKGKLTPMVLTGVSNGRVISTLEEQAEEVCSMYGCDRDEGMTWVEAIDEYLYEDVIIIDGVFYKKEDKTLDSFGFIESTKNDDGSFDYFVSFYNGGASLGEVLESIVKDVD